MTDLEVYPDLFSYELRTDELLRHHSRQYTYVGEPFHEYRLIYSLFTEINRLPGLSNRQIRWYAVIVNLLDRFAQRLRDVTAPGLTPDQFQDGPSAMLMGRRNLEVPDVPPYIDALETYARMVARWGVLVSAQRDIGADVIQHKNLRFHAQLRRLLEEMTRLQEEREAADDTYLIYILTVMQATKDIGTLEKHLSIAAEQCFSNALEPGLSSLYEEHIIKPSDAIGPSRLKDFFGLDDFWNGFRHT